jgi:hypothetical protein
MQSSWLLTIGFHARASTGGIAWTAATAAVMFALAAGKARIGAALGNPLHQTEGRVTSIDGFLAMAVLVGLLLNALLGWWWADPAASYLLTYYAVREARAILTAHRSRPSEPSARWRSLSIAKAASPDARRQESPRWWMAAAPTPAIASKAKRAR